MVLTIFSAACKSDMELKYEEAVKTLNTQQKNAQTLEKISQSRDKFAHLNIHLNMIKEAVKTLNTLQTNAQTLEKIRQSRDKFAHLNIPRMIKFAERVGIQMADMDRLNVIHVSGTKGKGSTCAYCESILRHHGYKTGFFSSPHLVEVRERFCVDGSPLEREKFASYFWEVYNLLEKSKEEHNGDMPNYFGFLTVMALHVFLKEQVDVAIMEVGIGGQFDSTNLLRKPVVCGVSSLGLDHTSILGSTVDKIAWHKSGIFKRDVPAFTVRQPPEAMAVIKQRAEEKGVPLFVSPDLCQFTTTPSLGIQGSVQAVNASLALQLCHTWIQKHNENTQEIDMNSSCTEQSPDQHTQNGAAETCCDIPVARQFNLTQEYLKGLENCKWLGRNQTLSRPGITFYLDGAHTVESIQQCVDWFVMQSEKEKQVKKEVHKVLIFNTTGDRDTALLLKPLLRCEFDSALFCPNIAYETAVNADQTNNTVTKESQLDRCHSNRQSWQKLATCGTANECTTEDISNGHGSSNGQSITDTGDIYMNSCHGNEDLHTFTTIDDCINWIEKRRSCVQDSTDKMPACNGNGVKDQNQNGKSSDNGVDQSDSVIKKPKLETNHVCRNGINGDTNVVDDGVHLQVLVTGSIHLVGGALKVLWDKDGQGNE